LATNQKLVSRTYYS